MKSFILFLILSLFATQLPTLNALTVAPYFGDHMVLQRDMKVPVWGKAAPGEKITVQFNGQSVTATAGTDGRWEAGLAPMIYKAAPSVLTVSGAKDKVEFKDVLIGDVWLGSGQSNCGAGGAGKVLEIAEKTPIMRFATQFMPAGAENKLDAPPRPIRWEISSARVARSRTAIGSGFLPYVAAATGIPQGFIAAFRAGTSIEPWISPEGYRAVPCLSERAQANLDKLTPEQPGYRKFSTQRIAFLKEWLSHSKTAAAANAALPPLEVPERIPHNSYPNTPTCLYNESFAAMEPMAVKGFIWYQGESNVGDKEYGRKLDAFAAGLRKNFRNPNMLFYLVQIMPFKGYGDNAKAAFLWEAQQDFVDRTPGAQLCVTTDHGDVNDWHPKNKEPIGIRFSNLALKYVYGRKDVKADFPRYKESRAAGSKFIITFANAAKLATSDGKAPNWFEVAGADDKYFPADAVIDGNKVILSSKQVKAPKKARLGWSNVAEPNLRNEIGLPPLSFRTERGK